MTAERRGTSPDESSEEMESAARLLDITDDRELDQLIGALLQGAARSAGAPLSPSLLRPMARTLAGTLKNVLPVVGSRGVLAPGSKSHVTRLTTAAGSMFGLELEGLSPEDQEFELARRFVRLTQAAGRHASRLGRALPPRVAARRTLVTAARRHAPGLFRRGARILAPAYRVEDEPEDATTPVAAPTCQCRECTCQRAASGTWVRDGTEITLQDI